MNVNVSRQEVGLSCWGLLTQLSHRQLSRASSGLKDVFLDFVLIISRWPFEPWSPQRTIPLAKDYFPSKFICIDQALREGLEPINKCGHGGCKHQQGALEALRLQELSIPRAQDAIHCTVTSRVLRFLLGDGGDCMKYIPKQFT